MYREIAPELKAIRVRKQVRAEDAARDLGVHVNTLRRYEKDDDCMPTKFLMEALQYYGVDPIIFFQQVRDYCNESEQ